MSTAGPSHAVHMLALLLCTSACTATTVVARKPTPLPQFLALSRAEVTTTYHIGGGDQLTIRFYYNPQLDQDMVVRPDGSITLSLIGELRAAGKTASELSAEVTKAYAQFFVKPTAVVIVRQFTSYRVFTAGELRNPGQFNLVTGAQTVLESLSLSGGVTDEGTLTHVFLIRRLADRREPIVAELDLRQALSGEDSTQDVALMPDDYVFVPRSGLADLNLALEQYFFRNLNFATGASFGVNYSVTPAPPAIILPNPNGVAGMATPPMMTPTQTMTPPTTPPMTTPTQPMTQPGQSTPPMR